jgi:predicted amidohydrolase
MAVDLLGRTLARLGGKEGLAIVDLDLSLVAQLREKFPLLKNRRADVCAN